MDSEITRETIRVCGETVGQKKRKWMKTQTSKVSRDEGKEINVEKKKKLAPLASSDPLLH